MILINAPTISIHSGHSVGRIRRLRLLAIVPVIIAAVINTGYQYLLAVQANSGEAGDGWRGSMAHFFYVDFADPGVYSVVIAGLIHIIPVFFFAVLAGGFCERLFAENRKRPFDSGIVYTALLFTLLMPPGVAIFHIVFGMSFAIILAQGIFGGEGRSFLNPALVGVAIVQISFPVALTSHPLWSGINGYAGSRELVLYHQQSLEGLTWSGLDWWQAFIGNSQGLIGGSSVLAVMLGAAVLLYGRIASWRLIGGQLLGLILAASLFNLLGGGIRDLPWYWHLVLGSYAFAAVFIATDPSSSAATNAGRWGQGILLGILLVLMRVLNDSHPDSVVPVLLLVSMTAPLIDHIVMWINIRQRGKISG
ncbi:MAG: RnfABCDGE type electron transport complex subunit D [Gammaproteobacteria bacterium]|nr:RnfABCDGE type electron transport complex subunit D [Gammaproteobacteria bacterium]